MIIIVLRDNDELLDMENSIMIVTNSIYEGERDWIVRDSIVVVTICEVFVEIVVNGIYKGISVINFLNTIL